jgi:hypothetical protein
VSLSPVTLKVAVSLVLLASMARAFLGAPAGRPRRELARGLLLLTAACYLVGSCLVLVIGAELPGSLIVVAGIEAACGAAWLVRGLPEGGGPGDEGGGGGGGEGPREPGPIDWGAFDRARRSWERTPALR